MDRELIRDYLKRSMFTEIQADALSRVFADLTTTFATREDLAELKGELKTELAAMEARMTWRIIGAMGLLATLLALLDTFGA